MTRLVNRAKMTTATTGTGTITLGSAETGYQTFAAAGVSDADVVRYVIKDGDDWEIGLGTYSSGTLTRGSIESSNSDSALNLTGEAVVFVSAAAGDIQQPPSEGAFADGDKTKLDGIEAGADVSTFSFCQVRNTDTTTDMNNDTLPVAIPFGGITDASSADYTLGTNGVVVNFDGVVNVQAHISQTSADIRTNVGIWIVKNGVKMSGVGQGAYIRRENYQTSSSSHISATFAVSDGDDISVRGEERGGAGPVTQVYGESQVTVERRS